MIKIKQVKTTLGRAVLVFEADFPDGTTRTVEIEESEIKERLMQVRNLLGRPVTIRDLKDVIKAIFNEIRLKKQVLPEIFDYSQFIKTDLEAEE